MNSIKYKKEVDVTTQRKIGQVENLGKSSESKSSDVKTFMQHEGATWIKEEQSKISKKHFKSFPK